MLDGVFSSLVEAVSGLTKREEECQLVEDETARMLSQHGGSSVMVGRKSTVKAEPACSLGTPPTAKRTEERGAVLH